MKRCPECRRDYYDDTLSFCLDDGSALLEGPGSGPVSIDEPATAMLHRTDAAGEAKTSSQTHTTDRTAILPNLIVSPAAATASRKNSLIAGVVGVILVTALGLGSYWLYGRDGSKQIESIAVMPFANGSGAADLDYLSDGMTETLIRSLSQLPNLNVKSRSSVFRYKGKEADARTIGKELGVQAVLNGRVIQRGDKLSLNLELINTENENVIWADEYDRKSSDLVSLQNDIARDVSDKLRLKLTSGDEQKLAKSYTLDPEAYRLYLQGRYYWNKRSGSEFEKAENFFRQAVEKDPNFALGYVGLADTNEDEDRPLKKQYIRKALDLDGQLAEAHASLGYQYMMDYDWAASERELKRAVELNPNYAPAHAWNGVRLMMLGRYVDAMASIQRALEIDPSSNGINFYHCVLLYMSGNTDESIQQFRRYAEIEPGFVWTHTWLARIYRETGNRAASVDERSLAYETGGQPENARRLREAFAKEGWDGYLHQFVRLGGGHSGTYRASVIGDASFLAELGEKEKAMDALVAAGERGDFWLFTIKVDPFMKDLRRDPRFQTLVKKFDADQ
ncbi:MAG: hypothetical protein ABI791_03020 [Acidobacteriota bacterium]